MMLSSFCRRATTSTSLPRAKAVVRRALLSTRPTTTTAKVIRPSPSYILSSSSSSPSPSQKTINEKTKASTTSSPLSLWQKQCWETYLSTGRGGDTLFQSISSNNQNQTISAQELHVFLDSVNGKGVHPRGT